MTLRHDPDISDFGMIWSMRRKDTGMLLSQTIKAVAMNSGQGHGLDKLIPRDHGDLQNLPRRASTPTRTTGPKGVE
jgi:hypothetical protein